MTGEASVSAAQPAPRLRRLAPHARWAAAALALAWLARDPAEPGAGAAGDRTGGLVLALAARGLEALPGDVHWIDRAPGAIASRLEDSRALVRAHRAGEPSDVFLVRVGEAPGGGVLRLRSLHELSDTSAVDESALTVSGERAAWAVVDGGQALSIHYADLRGESPEGTASWGALARAQDWITRWQRWGQGQGISLRSLELDPPAPSLRLTLTGDALRIELPGGAVELGAAPLGANGAGVVERTPPKARPGNLVTWAVDRARAHPWLGSDRIQLLKVIGFALLDWAQQLVGTVTGDDGSDEIREELGDQPAPALAYTDPETGWPPPPLQPILKPALEGEGQWRLLDSDPFVRVAPGMPAALAQTFVRPDRKRGYVQMWVLLWDPRQIELRTMSGTIEPKSATGATGPGRVPRDAATMGRYVGAFNGGFQATHGEFGMMSDGVVYLPPKPYAATVARLRDGTTAFGTWPNDEQVPDSVLDFRQNMTPMVMDGALNPYHRTWWGGVPPGWTDESRTARSALCLTEERFVAYLYGGSVDADHMALAMQTARCIYGIHLDMNPGHTGLELYRADPAAEQPPLGRPIDPKWEIEGDVRELPGWRFRGRRMLRYMGLMNSPGRYMEPEARDFFFLLLRPLVPGAAVALPGAAALPGDGEWTVRDLPQHGWPYALATATVHPAPERADLAVRLLQLDPRRLAARDPGAAADALVVSVPVARPAAAGEAVLWLDGDRCVTAEAAPSPAARALAVGRVGATRGGAAIGVHPDTGRVYYAEPSVGDDATVAVRVLAALGVEAPLVLAQPLDAALGGGRTLAGNAPRAGARLALVRVPGPSAQRFFTDTPVVSIKEWHPLQAKRVRYFRKPDPPRAAASSASPPSEPPP
ncbi:MAG: hypothetical protein IT376_21450 [Polyangiaceae bacterium]|nr:hypothetical protein [Polyangiaceae bacterium]